MCLVPQLLKESRTNNLMAVRTFTSFIQTYRAPFGTLNPLDNIPHLWCRFFENCMILILRILNGRDILYMQDSW